MKIIFADKNEKLVDVLHKTFETNEQVTVHHGSIFDISCDALINPMTNSFGFMDCGLELEMTKFFGWHLQQNLQNLIVKKHHGELLVGTADLLETNHSQIPYLICAPTMRVPMLLKGTVNVYLAVRATLNLIKFGQFEDGTHLRDKIKVLAIPDMGVDMGKLSPEICAKQMKQAIEEIMEEKHEFPNFWWDAHNHHYGLIYSTHRLPS